MFIPRQSLKTFLVDGAASWPRPDADEREQYDQNQHQANAINPMPASFHLLKYCPGFMEASTRRLCISNPLQCPTSDRLSLVAVRGRRSHSWNLRNCHRTRGTERSTRISCRRDSHPPAATRHPPLDARRPACSFVTVILVLPLLSVLSPMRSPRVSRSTSPCCMSHSYA